MSEPPKKIPAGTTKWHGLLVHKTPWEYAEPDGKWYPTTLGAILAVPFGVVAVVVFVFALVSAFFPLGRHLGHEKCKALAPAIGQETVFVSLNYYEWQCLTLVDGQMVSAEDYQHMIQLRKVGGTNTVN